MCILLMIQMVGLHLLEVGVAMGAVGVGVAMGTVSKWVWQWELVGVANYNHSIHSSVWPILDKNCILTNGYHSTTHSHPSGS